MGVVGRGSGFPLDALAGDIEETIGGDSHTCRHVMKNRTNEAKLNRYISQLAAFSMKQVTAAVTSRHCNESSRWQ